MAHVISMDESEIWATPNARLEALKGRNLPTPDDQNLNKIMGPNLYEATKKGDVQEFMDALEKVSDSRKLALSLIFDHVTPSGNSLLHVAASSGSEHLVKLILIHYPDLVTKRNSSEDTPLHVAVQEGRTNATERLIRADSEIIYRKNKDSKSPLYLAVENCKPSDSENRKGADWEILQLLLQEAAQDEAYEVKIQGMSPVLAALEEGKIGILEEVVEWLPKLLHVRGEDGGTPLHYAASLGNYKAVQVLLEKCPDLALLADKNGSYPIHITCQESSSFPTIYKLIEHKWPDLAEIKNNKGQNILHVAAEAGNNDAVYMISFRVDKAVIKQLANSKDADGNTPLHLASMHNHCGIMLYLSRDKRTNLSLLNNDRLTALDVAMKSESFSTIYPALLGRAILITAGVPWSRDPKVRSQRGNAEWRKNEVNTRLLVATLVATVTFAVGFTLPGGYNASSDPRPGTAAMLHNRVFQVFIIANMLVTYSSILGVVVLLWGHMTGLLLVIALTNMSVAFSAGVILAVSKLTWLASLVLSVVVVFLMTLVMVLGTLIFPFSKTAMHIVSLYHLVLALPRYVVRRFECRNDSDSMKSYIYLF